MPTSANVHSLESVENVRRAIALFDEQVANALTELGAEMRRMLDWLDHDRPRHWKMQIRRATDEVHEAQQALRRCLMFPIANERPSCYEERMNLKKAQAKLEYCLEKENRVRHWQRAVQHELFEYEGRISQLVQLVEIDMPQAMGVLTKVIRNLEEYQSGRAAYARAAYDDVSFARELWPENQADGEAASAKVSQSESAAGPLRPDTPDNTAAATSTGIESEAPGDAKV
jgi:hypothetical protein